MGRPGATSAHVFHKHTDGAARTPTVARVQLEATVEGENIMRMARIELAEPPAMAPCINIACPIGPDSPLWGKTHADLENEGAAIYVALAATDNQHFQEVYARRFYLVQVLPPRTFAPRRLQPRSLVPAPQVQSPRSLLCDSGQGGSVA